MKNEQLIEALRPDQGAHLAWPLRPVPRALPHVLKTPSSPPAPDPVSARLCIVVPTYNERSNVDALVRSVEAALVGVAWEMIIVDDDSPDGTADHVRSLHEDNPRVRVIRRLGRRGLASACIEGMLASSSPFVAVMDGDLQHDPKVLRQMLLVLEAGEVDLVAASRYIAGGTIGDWSQERAATSRFATRLAQAVSPVPLSDPMSGFFAIRRKIIDQLAPDLSAVGFKILLDIAMTAGPDLRVEEVPLRFACRQEGSSKLSVGVAWDYAMMLADKRIGRLVPVELVAFAAVAIPTMVLHLAISLVLVGSYGIDVAATQLLATGIALIALYAAQNVLACRPGPRRGWRWLSGLMAFGGTTAIGVAASVVVASVLLKDGMDWSVAGSAGMAACLTWTFGAGRRYAWCAA